jgi:hypothetical protein
MHHAYTSSNHTRNSKLLERSVRAENILKARKLTKHLAVSGISYTYINLCRVSLAGLRLIPAQPYFRLRFQSLPSKSIDLL